MSDESGAVLPDGWQWERVTDITDEPWLILKSSDGVTVWDGDPANPAVPILERLLCLQAENAELKRLATADQAEREAWSQYLKDGETPLQRIEREIKDCCSLLRLLADEKRKVEQLAAQVAALRGLLHELAQAMSWDCDENWHGDLKDRVDAALQSPVTAGRGEG